LPIALLDRVPRGHFFRERLRHALPAGTAALDCQALCSDNKHLTDSATDPTVKEEVLECITSWLNQTNCPCKCDQLRIGRHLLIRGYVATEWTKIQERYYKDQHETAKLSLNGQTWTKDLIHFLRDEAFQLWDKRNKEIYETENDNNSTLLFDLKQQIRELYNLEEKVLAQDRNNFALPLTK
jgi:hypothetical protein